MNPAKRERNTRILDDKRSRFQLKVDSDCCREKANHLEPQLNKGVHLAAIMKPVLKSTTLRDYFFTGI